MSYTWEQLEKVSDCDVSKALQYLKDGTPPVMPSFEPVGARNEHNCHSAAKWVAGAALLLAIGWISYLAWLGV